MITPDLINGFYEFIGGLLLYRNVYQLYKDKQIKGVSILTTAFFASWGYWNLFYYPSLNQWMSFWGGACVVSANTIWVAQAIYYSRKNK
jgi:hypothetical protein